MLSPGRNPAWWEGTRMCWLKLMLRQVANIFLEFGYGGSDADLVFIWFEENEYVVILKLGI